MREKERGMGGTFSEELGGALEIKTKRR